MRPLIEHKSELSKLIEDKPHAEPLKFTELHSCCGELYGYMDQFGNEYNLDKQLTKAAR